MRSSSCFVSASLQHDAPTSDFTHTNTRSDRRVTRIHAGRTDAWTSTNPRNPHVFFVTKLLPIDRGAQSCVTAAGTCRTVPIISPCSNIHSTRGRYEQGGQVHEGNARRGRAAMHQLCRGDQVLRTQTERWPSHSPESQDQALDIDTSHFTGRPRVLGGSAVRRHWTTILTERPVGSSRVKPHLLRRALIEAGRDHLCGGCGIDPIWNGGDLVFHVDHIDGNPNDSRPENVRFLCPNCHSQTPTWAGSDASASTRIRQSHDVLCP